MNENQKDAKIQHLREELADTLDCAVFHVYNEEADEEVDEEVEEK